MHLLIMSLGIILFAVLLYFNYSPPTQFADGFSSQIKQNNPIFFSDNKSQKIKKTNMLRISKMRRKS